MSKGGTKKVIDLVGRRFGRLVVLRRAAERNHLGLIVWECLCDCGNTTTKGGGPLKSKNTMSCGCYQRDARLRRGKLQTIKKLILALQSLERLT